MSIVGDIAAGLKENLDAIDGINVSQIPRSNPTPPIIHLWPSEIPTYHLSMTPGISEIDFTVQLVLDYIDDTTAFKAYAYLDPNDGDLSIAGAIEADKTLGGLVDRLQVVSSPGISASVTVDQQERLTAEWVVRIWI